MTEPITMLCRHMLLDLKSMRIISLGIPKAVKLNEFCEIYNIDKKEVDTNTIITSNNIDTPDTKTNKYNMYYFSEGTMMTYNPSLSKYNVTIVDYESDDDTPNEYRIETFNTKKSKRDEMEDMEPLEDALITDIENPIEVKFNKQFIYSTRKVLGTSSFNSSKTFLDMFQDNNKVNKIDLDKIPNRIYKRYCSCI